MGYCEGLIEAGLPLMRVHVAQSGFHPKYGGLGYDWTRADGFSEERYSFTETPQEQWLQSPFYHMLLSGLDEYRERLSTRNAPSAFPLLNDLRDIGATDYFAMGLVLSKQGEREQIDPDDPNEGLMISWSSDGPDGFSDDQLDLIRAGLPYLGLGLKSASNRQMARDLLGVYLGREAGGRVLSGDIQRGDIQTINAVICYFDLTGFTRLTEATAGDALIAMLNDYFGIAVEAVQEQGGNILKFMGDGMMAMFDFAKVDDAAVAALAAASAMRSRIDARNHEREAQNLPITDFTLALHAGEILYGNIGAENRLDFTVIGPAVNLTARLSGMHRALGQDMIVTDKVREAVGETGHDLVSLGRYMLRGVAEPMELFTVYTPT